MAIRVGRGLLRLWIVASVVWIGAVATTSWESYSIYEAADTSKRSALESVFTICRQAKTAKDCSDLLVAARRNPFDAADLEWGENGFLMPTMKFEGIAWERLPLKHAFGPPVLLLVIGSALLWALRGFRSSE